MYECGHGVQSVHMHDVGDVHEYVELVLKQGFQSLMIKCTFAQSLAQTINFIFQKFNLIFINSGM